jgi:pyruvate,water dikinase
MRFIGRPEPVLVTVPQRDRLEGWPTSPGVFSGIARVVSSPHDAFGEDEVLVAVSTDPSWSALFARAGAIVLERGGPLSHAAILARELGVPAVLNVPHAVVLLAGRRVVVDGGAGIVAIVDPETATPQDAGAQAATTAPTDEPILR